MVFENCLVKFAKEQSQNPERPELVSAKLSSWFWGWRKADWRGREKKTHTKLVKEESRVKKWWGKQMSAGSVNGLKQ